MPMETIREALHYAHQGGRLSRPVIGLDWVEEAARRSQVTLLACGVQGSVSTLPDAAAAALCAAAAAAGDRVVGVVTKHTAVRALGGDGSEMSGMRLELEEAVLEVAFLTNTRYTH